MRVFWDKLLHREDEGKDTASDKKPGGAEFTQRVTRLLIVCVEGICKLVPDKDELSAHLAELARVLKSASRFERPEGLMKEIEDFFTRKKLEESLHATEKEELKKMVVEMTKNVKEMVTTSGDFGQDMGGFIDKIEKADTLEDIRLVKDQVIGEIRKIRSRSMSLNEELSKYREETNFLLQRLEQSEAKALVDALTNVLNRNAYDLKIGQMIREFARYKDPGGLMVIDIDFFKKFNDTYGHKAGDNVLRSVATVLKENVRESDLVFRYGGEEFVLLVHKVDAANAARLAEKIRLAVEKDYYVDQNQKLKVTISVGLACLREGDTEQTLFVRADQALYAAKKAGRNRVTVAG